MHGLCFSPPAYARWPIPASPQNSRHGWFLEPQKKEEYCQPSVAHLKSHCGQKEAAPPRARRRENRYSMHSPFCRSPAHLSFLTLPEGLYQILHTFLEFFLPYLLKTLFDRLDSVVSPYLLSPTPFSSPRS